MSAVDYFADVEWTLGRLEDAIRDMQSQMQQGTKNNLFAGSLEARRHARAIIDKLKMFDHVLRDDPIEKLKIVK